MSYTDYPQDIMEQIRETKEDIVQLKREIKSLKEQDDKETEILDLQEELGYSKEHLIQVQRELEISEVYWMVNNELDSMSFNSEEEKKQYRNQRFREEGLSFLAHDFF